MVEMTSIERISNILKRKPVDRIGLFEDFWGDTQRKWTGKGHIEKNEDISDHFGLDIRLCDCFNMIADINFKTETVEETEETILQRDGNGALLRRHKLHEATPEHVYFMVKERNTWDEKIKPMLTPSNQRINFKKFKNDKENAHTKKRFFCWAGNNVFELMHPLCGHEYMLMGMALDPEWVKDMVNTYSDLIISLMEILFAEAGRPDGIWFYDDLGFKEHSFMSPGMYQEIIQPGHKKIFDFVHSLSLPVIFHSCGYVAPLVSRLIEAGIDCLQVIEVKAGMDLLKLKKEFGGKIALCGGMDALNLVANNLDAIAEELNKKIPLVMKGSGYILHSDHSIPDQCEYETYRFFVNKGLKLGTY